MSVQTSFVQTVQGQWVTLAEYREHRKSLLIQCLSGPLIICTSTAGPTVATLAGDMPAGIMQSIDTLNPVTLFRLSERVDDDLVHQQWNGWVPGSGSVTDAYIRFTYPGLNNVAVSTDPINAGIVIVVGVAIGPAALAPVCTSSLIGPIAPAVTQGIGDGAGDAAVICLFIFSTIGGDIITVDASADPVGVVDAVAVNGPGVAPDTAGATFGAGGSIPVSAISPVVGLNELVAVGFISFPANGFNTLPPGWFHVGGVAGGLTSNDGTVWWLDAGWIRWPSISIPTSTLTAAAVFSGCAATILAATFTPLGLNGPVVTVIEAFDTHTDGLPDVSRPMFSVELPKLTADGVTALQELLNRLPANQPQEGTDDAL